MPKESEILSNFVKLKALFNKMIVEGPKNMRSQLVEAKEIQARVFSIQEHCQTTVQTLAKLARGEIDLHKAKVNIAQSLHADSSEGMQYALSEGDNFKVENISSIVVKIKMADHVSHDELIALMDFAVDFAERANTQ